MSPNSITFMSTPKVNYYAVPTTLWKSCKNVFHLCFPRPSGSCQNKDWTLVCGDEKCKQIYANGFLAVQHIWYESSGPRLESQTNCSEILQPLRLADIFQVACMAKYWTLKHMMMQWSTDDFVIIIIHTTYVSICAGREKWPFNVLFFKVEPLCDQTWWDSLVFSILSCFSYVLHAKNTLVGPVGPF